MFVPGWIKLEVKPAVHQTPMKALFIRFVAVAETRQFARRFAQTEQPLSETWGETFLLRINFILIT
jgi:hypothetical protein